MALKIKESVIRAETAEEKIVKIQTDLEASLANIQADREKIGAQLAQITALTNEIEALKALREELEIRLRRLISQVTEKDRKIIAEKKLSKTAQARVALLNQQIKALRAQISKISQTLEASERVAEQQKVKIANLGSRLNAALASKVQELSRYRSEFFGRLRDARQPAGRPDCRGPVCLSVRGFIFKGI